MKHAYNFTAGILGFIFIVFGLNFFLKFIDVPQPFLKRGISAS